MRVLLIVLGFASATCAARAADASFVRSKLDPFLAHRCDSAEAKGKFYEETVNAFRTHLDDVHGCFDAWITPDHGLWQGEYWGKNLLAQIAVARSRGDLTRQRELVQAALAFVREFQRADGYIGTYADAEFIVPKDPKKEFMCWNLWGRKYTLWALVDCARLAGTLKLSDDRKALLDAASRLMDQQIAMLKRRGLREIDTGCFDGVASASVLKPLLLLYRETGKPVYLVHAREIVASMDDPSADNPPPNLVRNAFRDEPVHLWYPMAKTPDGERQHTKAYEIMSCYEGLVEFWKVTGERRPLEAARRFADKVAETEANAVGAVGFGDHFAHASARHNTVNELCDVLHWLRLCCELYEATGDERHLDRMETAYYNALLAGAKADGRWANHGVRAHGYGHFTSQHEVGMKFHECCVDNLPRVVETWPRAAVVEAKDGSVRVNFYDDATYVLSDGVLTVSGNYPIGKEVTVTLKAKCAHEVKFRRPGWTKDMRVSGGGGVWKVAFDMMPVLVRETGAANLALKPEDPEAFLYRLSALRGAAKDCPLRYRPGVRVMRGPLILAKAARLGTSDAEVFAEPLAADPKAKAEIADGDACGTWKLTLRTEKGEFCLPVCPLATAEAGSQAFSVWF